MKDNIRIGKQSNLYFISGFDGNFYLIRLNSNHDLEVKIPSDTFELLKMCISNEVTLAEAISHCEIKRDVKQLLSEIEQLIKRGLIIL